MTIVGDRCTDWEAALDELYALQNEFSPFPYFDLSKELDWHVSQACTHVEAAIALCEETLEEQAA
jgi:hypothetical protein